MPLEARSMLYVSMPWPIIFIVDLRYYKVVCMLIMSNVGHVNFF